MKMTGLAALLLLTVAASTAAADEQDKDQACRLRLKVIELRTAWAPGEGPLGTAGEDLYLKVLDVERNAAGLCDLARAAQGIKIPQVDKTLGSATPEVGKRLNATLLYGVEAPGEVRSWGPKIIAVLEPVAHSAAIVSGVEFLYKE